MRSYLVFFAIVMASCQEPIPSSAPNPSNLTEQNMSANLLQGTYINAGKNTAIALIVPGSGPTDKNGNSGKNLQANTYKFLAEQLGAKNISTVRVDKRGLFTSAKAGDANAVSVDIYANDYRLWIDTLKTETGAECIYLIGHSEGALMVSAAAIGRNDVCGLILISGMGRNFGDVLRAQLKANAANLSILKQALNAIDALETGQSVDTKSLHPALLALFREDVQNYLRSLMSVDPAKMAANADTPTLIIQGKTDLQTSVEDAKLLVEATNGQLVLLDDVNHVLKIAPMNRKKNFATYTQPDVPVADSVVLAIEHFINP